MLRVANSEILTQNVDVDLFHSEVALIDDFSSTLVEATIVRMQIVDDKSVDIERILIAICRTKEEMRIDVATSSCNDRSRYPLTSLNQHSSQFHACWCHFTMYWLHVPNLVQDLAEFKCQQQMPK